MYSVRKGVLENFAKFGGKHLRQSLFLNKELQASGLQLYLKKTLAQVISCEFSEIFKNTFLQKMAIKMADSVNYQHFKTLVRERVLKSLAECLTELSASDFY